MIHKSFCRICASSCGILVEVQDEQVLSVRGDVEDPLTRGYTCSKGRNMGHSHHRSDRLLHPKMRKDGKLQEAGWDETLDDLAARLKAIIAESGPDAVGIFLGGGCYLDSPAYAMLRQMRAALGTKSYYSDMSIDVMSKVVVAEMIGGFACMPRPDFGRCKLVIYVGSNPMVSHGHTSMLNNPAVRLREFTTDGEVWVLDPRRTETAMKATRHLTPKPGSDYAILAFLVRELLQQGADFEYLEQHAQDVDRLEAAVAPFTLARTVELSELPAEALIDFLAAVRRAGRLCVETGTGISMSPAANLTAWMSWALMIVTGSLDREGGAWSNPGFFNKLEQLEIPSAPPEGWRLPGPASRPELRTVAGEYVCAAMPDEIASGNLRALINLSGNLVTCMPGTEQFMAALGKLEVLATIEIVDNTMANISTHALPSKDQLERPDISLAVDGAFSELGAQFTPAMLKPLGEVRSYWWILAELGKRMGLDFFPGFDPDTTTDEDIVGVLAKTGRMPIDASGEAHYTFAGERVFGWLQARADALGGWRVAPLPLVEQLAALEPLPPLVLISRRQLHQHNSRKVVDKREIPAIYLNPHNAGELGLGEGDIARVSSAHGSLEGRIIVDTTLIRGTLSVPHGWEGRYNVNQLTSVSDIDVITGMPRFSNLPVELMKISSSAVQAALEPV